MLSALGLVASDERRDRVRSYLVPLREAGELPRDGEADLRYAGQSFELTVPLQRELAEAFHRAHEARLRLRGPRARDRARRGAHGGRSAGAVVRPAARARRSDVAGPAVVELDGSTCWTPPGWVGARDGPTLVLTRL